MRSIRTDFGVFKLHVIYAQIYTWILLTMNSENGHWKLSDNNESIRIVRFFLTIYLLHNPKHLWCVCALFSGRNSLFGFWVDLNWAQSENEPRRKLMPLHTIPTILSFASRFHWPLHSNTNAQAEHSEHTGQKPSLSLSRQIGWLLLCVGFIFKRKNPHRAISIFMRFILIR